MKLITKTLSLLSLVATFYIMINNCSNFQALWLLPFFLFIFNILLRSAIMNYSYSIVFLFIYFIINIRYLFLPLLITFDTSFYGNQSYNANWSIMIMLIELLAVFFAFKFHFSVVENKQKRDIALHYKRNPLLLLFLLATFIYIYISGYFYQVNFVWNIIDFRNLNKEIEISSLAGLLFYPCRVIFSLYLLSRVYQSHVSIKNKVLLAFCLLSINSVIIIGLSRFSILLFSVPFFIIIVSLFKQTKIILSLSSVLFVFIIIISTVQKFIKADDGGTEDISLITSQSLNAYFSGPGNISIGLDSYEQIENLSRSDFILNDYKQNIPILSRSVNINKTANVIFNEKIYNHRLYQDQIVPISLSGLLHLSILGVFIYPFILTILSLWFEKKFRLSRDIGLKFVFISLAFSTSLFFMMNLSSIISKLVVSFFFLYIPIKISLLINKMKI